MKIICARFEQEKKRYTYFSVEKELPQLSSSDVLVQVKSCKLLDIRSETVKELFAKYRQIDIPGAVEVAGLITETGSQVTSLKHNDRVVGFIPLISEWSGCAEYCVLGEFDVVKLPDSIDYLLATSVLGDVLHAYTALQYMAKLDAGDVVLILDGAASWARVTIQLALIWGAKVIAVVSTMTDKSALEKLPLPPDVVVVNNSNTLVNDVMEETSGLGVDVVIDNGVCLFPHEDHPDTEMIKVQFPSKHDIISTLTVGGTWVTSCPHIQLDPPDCDQLLMRSATVSFLFSQTWLLCPSKHGKLQHILGDFAKKLSEKKLKILPAQSISFTELLNSVESGITIQPGTLIKL